MALLAGASLLATSLVALLGGGAASASGSFVTVDQVVSSGSSPFSISTSSPDEVIVIAADGWPAVSGSGPTVTVDGNVATELYLDQNVAHNTGVSSTWVYTAPTAGSHTIVVNAPSFVSPYFNLMAVSLIGATTTGVVYADTTGTTVPSVSAPVGSYVLDNSEFNRGGAPTGAFSWTGSPEVPTTLTSTQIGTGIDTVLGGESAASTGTYSALASDTGFLFSPANTQGMIVIPSSVPVYSPGTPSSPPTDLTATVDQITLNWSPPVSPGTSPITSYEVFRFTANTAATQIATVDAPTTSYVDNNVTAGVTYSYYVEAENAYGVSAPSNIVSATATSSGPAPSPSSCSGASGTTGSGTSTTTGSGTSSNSGNAAFVCALYEDILGRAPDTAGLNSWVSALNSGTSTTQVAYDIATSNEYRTDYIESDYQAFLARAADPGGLSTWLFAFNSGATDEQVDAGILGSPEFFSDAGSTNSGFINAVYQDLLGRPADPEGLATWNSDLSNGMSRTQVAYAIDTSNESRTDSVEHFYGLFLNRPADPAGLSTWLGALSSGATNEQVLAGIAGSPEFYADATGT